MSQFGSAARRNTPSRAVTNACMKGIVCPSGILPLSHSQFTLMPKPKVASATPCSVPSCQHTRSRKNHKGYLCGDPHKVGHFNNAPFPISIPLYEIRKNNLDCRLPNKDIVTLSEAWPCDSPMLPPLIVFSVRKIWAISDLLNRSHNSRHLRKRCTVLEDSLFGQIEHEDNHVAEH
jgi:hypothetical protein